MTDTVDRKVLNSFGPMERMSEKRSTKRWYGSELEKIEVGPPQRNGTQKERRAI